MQFKRYKTILLRILGEDMVSLLKKTNAIIAGGSITSLFSSSEINDFDVYFRSKEDLIIFIRNAFKQYGSVNESDDLYVLNDEDKVKFISFNAELQNQTARSVTFTQNSNTIQLIHFDYFKNSDEIFSNYDFHCNMASFDFMLDEFVLHDMFLESVAARRLTFNENTRYPIMSTLRVLKYIDRGYTINRKEMFKIGITCSKLNINSWDNLIDQLSGFYGIEVQDLFDTTQPFSLELGLEMLDNVFDLPEHDIVKPTFKQIMFTIAGNPYKDRNIVYKILSIVKIDEVLYYKDDFSETLFTPDGEYVDIKITNSKLGMPIEYRNEYIMPWQIVNGRTVYGVLQMSPDSKVSRSSTNYHATGKMRLIGIKR